MGSLMFQMRVLVTGASDRGPTATNDEMVGGAGTGGRVVPVPVPGAAVHAAAATARATISPAAAVRERRGKNDVVCISMTLPG